MSEHDVLDEGSELSELRELHRQERMPAEVRERLMRRVRAPSSLARSEVGDADDVDHDSRGHARDDHEYGAHGLIHTHGSAAIGSHADGIDASPGEPARPSWVPSLLVGGRRREKGASARRAAYGLGASALVAAGVALTIGGPNLRPGVVPQHEPPGSEATSQVAREPERPSGDPNLAEMRVVGWLIPDSLAHLAVLPPNQRGGCRYIFRLRPLAAASNAVLQVESGQCLLPDPVIDPAGSCVKVTADGYLDDDGHLEASRLSAVSARCP